MVRVAIVGRMGSGKSEVLNYLKKSKQPVFEADSVVKKLLFQGSPVYSQLKAHFGDDYLLDNRNFNPKTIARDVFNDEKKLKILERILHPEVWCRWRDFSQKQKMSPFVFCEMPLFNKGIRTDQFDFIVLVKASDHLKLKRLAVKKISEKEAVARWKNQMLDSDFLNQAQFVIENEGTLKSLQNKIDKLLSFLRAKIKNDSSY